MSDLVPSTGVEIMLVAMIMIMCSVILVSCTTDVFSATRKTTEFAAQNFQKFVNNVEILLASEKEYASLDVSFTLPEGYSIVAFNPPQNEQEEHLYGTPIPDDCTRDGTTLPCICLFATDDIKIDQKNVPVIPCRIITHPEGPEKNVAFAPNSDELIQGDHRGIEETTYRIFIGSGNQFASECTLILYHSPSTEYLRLGEVRIREIPYNSLVGFYYEKILPADKYPGGDTSCGLDTFCGDPGIKIIHQNARFMPYACTGTTCSLGQTCVLAPTTSGYTCAPQGAVSS